MNIKVIRHDSIGSTNSEALDHARRGADEGLCIIASQQTAGRGRYGRTWVSTKDSGLYFSIVLRPRLEIKFLPLITLMAGVAVHETLAEFGLEPDIKWVNDVLVNEKKIAGILAETSETDKGLAVVVGIGINLRSSNFPPEIAETATSVETATHQSVRSPEVEQALLRHLGHFYDKLQSFDGPVEILKEWQKRSSYFSGKDVVVSIENETFTGTTDGLEPNGALRVRRPGGEILSIHAGDVEKLRSQPREW
jgi:BirA family biotin operon repressor/biotin-[acetyl-CoA-carboxylase] ligase